MIGFFGGLVFFKYIFKYIFGLFLTRACGILVPRPGIELWAHGGESAES